MSVLSHAIVWIDHTEARVIHFDAGRSTQLVVRAPGGPPHLHHKANSIDSGHQPEDQRYLHAVGQAIKGSAAVLIAGPANAKLELMRHLGRHDPELLGVVAGVETVDHPTNGQLLAHARQYFRFANAARALGVPGHGR